MEEQPTTLGRGGPEIAVPLGMGLWAWGDKYTWGYSGYDAALDVSAMRGAYSAALAGGANLFDTAEAYGGGVFSGWGASERFLGACMKPEAGGGDPAAAPADPGLLRPVVVSKYIPLPWRLFEPRCLLGALRSSVDRLGVDALDVYLIHCPVATFNSIKTLASSLAAAVDSGLTKAVGVSNYSEGEMRQTHRVLAEAGVPLVANQVEFSLLHALPSRNGLLDSCNELGVSMMAYSPLAMGRLTGKYSADSPPRGARRFGNLAWSSIQPVADRLGQLGDAHGGKTRAQVALNWLICKGAVPIPGAKNAAQAEGNVGALGWRLSSGDVDELDDVAVQGVLKFGQHG